MDHGLKGGGRKGIGWKEQSIIIAACNSSFFGEKRQNLHVFNLWPVTYHTEKNSCGNPTPETLSVEICTSQQDYPRSTHFYFVAINISKQKTVPVQISHVVFFAVEISRAW
jgi:hypothetical protein